MHKFTLFILSLTIYIYPACFTGSEYLPRGPQVPIDALCQDPCDGPVHDIASNRYYYDGYNKYTQLSDRYAGRCPYTPSADFITVYGPLCASGDVICDNTCSYTKYCTTASEACEATGNVWVGGQCQPPPDTLCVNIPLSISAQLGTSARAYYVKNEDGSLSKILNDGNADRLCAKSIEQGTGEVNVINNLVGPDGENYGTFCLGSCESAGQSNGGQISCNIFGCHESNDQGGAINPNDYGSQNSDFGAGTGGGFGSGGGSGGGDGSGIIGDSIPPQDSIPSAPSWSDGCQVLNLQTCTCDGFTYVGSSNMTATVYNHKTGQSGSCSVEPFPEVASCPVDWSTCNFKKTPQDTSSYAFDSLRTDSLGDWEYNYFPILQEINNSIKALDYNQNSNAKDMQNFFNNYKGTNFEGTPKKDTTIINITNNDTTIVELPDESIDFDFIYDSIANWNSSINKVKDTLSSFSYFNPEIGQDLELDTSGSIGRIISTASTIIDSGKVSFPLNLQSFSGQSNCPAFMTQSREIKTFVGSSHSFNFSFMCDVRIFGKELFALIRAGLRLLVSISCAWMIFKASVNFREG